MHRRHEGNRPVLPLSARRLLSGSICRDRSSGLLHEAGETTIVCTWIVDGADDDWASWYAQWLIDLVSLLVSLDKQYTAEAPGEPWETY